MHFLMILIFATLVGVVFGATARDTARQRLLYGLKVFAEFIGVGLALGWVLYFLPL
jgi:F0F1-type ATP synthase assembly protein I